MAFFAITANEIPGSARMRVSSSVSGSYRGSSASVDDRPWRCRYSELSRQNEHSCRKFDIILRYSQRSAKYAGLGTPSTSCVSCTLHRDSALSAFRPLSRVPKIADIASFPLKIVFVYR